MERRSAFVAEVGRTIRARHGSENESFVFGLSGKWGEGKSHFLDELEVDLRSNHFEVLHLNPWKYAADRVAFLRSFLIGLLEEQKFWSSRVPAAFRLVRRGQVADAVEVVMPRSRLVSRLKSDVSRQRISFSRLFILLIAVLVAYWVYSVGLAPDVQRAVLDWRLPITLVLVPMAVWLIQGLANSQTSSKAATTVDEFDRLVNLAIGAPDAKATRPSQGVGVRKIVIFVDDLDRVTASVARGVLDNLRSFFDKPSLSFVVAGDHTVLEESVGRELVPNREAAQADEGRRFMKKIFNLYWRLPAPVQSDFVSFVTGQIAERQALIDQALPNSADCETLRRWLTNYSSLNLRSVVRTLDMLLFTLALVRAQAEVATAEEKPGLQEILAKPMLLGRVLMIQDRCAPLFDLLVETPSLLADLDREVFLAKSRAQEEPVMPVDAFLTSLRSDRGPVLLNPESIEFLRRFAYEQPLFWGAGGQEVANVGPWIHLAGDLSFADAAGPRPDDFVRDLTNSNSEAMSVAMARCSEAKAPAVADAAIRSLIEDEDFAARSMRLSLLINAAVGADQDRPLAVDVIRRASGSPEALLAGMPGQQRRDALLEILDGLDRHSLELPSAVSDSAAYRADFVRPYRVETMGPTPRQSCGSGSLRSTQSSRHTRRPSCSKCCRASTRRV